MKPNFASEWLTHIILLKYYWLCHFLTSQLPFTISPVMFELKPVSICFVCGQVSAVSPFSIEHSSPAQYLAVKLYGLSLVKSTTSPPRTNATTTVVIIKNQSLSSSYILFTYIPFKGLTLLCSKFVTSVCVYALSFQAGSFILAYHFFFYIFLNRSKGLVKDFHNCVNRV